VTRKASHAISRNGCNNMTEALCVQMESSERIVT
jgi:hypothetical protein